MKIVMVSIIDTDKQISDGITTQIPDGKISDNFDLGLVLLVCEKAIRKLAKEAKERAGELDE
jgi:hypothetical protein